MQLYYAPTLLQSSFLDETESHHCVRVLRGKQGDNIRVTNGIGTVVEAVITEANAKRVTFEILSTAQKALPTCHKLHIAIAPTKSIDRFEWFVEKAAEIGIGTITPIICKHSERKTVRIDRLNNILLSAMKQSINYWLERVNEPIEFTKFLNEPGFENQKFIAYCEEKPDEHLYNLMSSNASTIILIGPEGDFTPQELKLAIDKGYKTCSLGEKRLRTETAAIVACHTFAMQSIKKI